MAVRDSLYCSALTTTPAGVRPFASASMIVSLTLLCWAACVSELSSRAAGIPLGVTYLKHWQGNRDVLDTSVVMGTIEGSRNDVTKIRCAGWCTRQTGCKGFSMAINSGGDQVVCKFSNTSQSVRTNMLDGVDFFIKVTPADLDGFSTHLSPYQFKRINMSASSLQQARLACAAAIPSATLPVPYPDPRSYEALRLFIRIYEAVYVGVKFVGGQFNQTFVTDRGNPLDAAEKDNDTNQHWGPNQPDAMGTNSGQAVIMDGLGDWHDVSNSTTVTSVICFRRAGYLYLSTPPGKYYRLEKTNLKTWPDAQRVCEAEGARLAVLYGSYGNSVLTYFVQQQGGATFWIAGSDNVTEGQWVFPDGAVLNSAIRGSDPRQIWCCGGPDGGTAENCLMEFGLLWGTIACTIARTFLCEGLF